MDRPIPATEEQVSFMPLGRAYHLFYAQEV
jgi:hypothetical protein